MTREQSLLKFRGRQRIISVTMNLPEVYYQPWTLWCELKVPRKVTTHSAGFDLYSAVSCVLSPKSRRLLWTGIKLYIPNGWCGKISPKLSMSLKRIEVRASVVESNCHSEIWVLVVNNSEENFNVNPRDVIGQIIFPPIVLIRELKPILTNCNILQGGHKIRYSAEKEFYLATKRDRKKRLALLERAPSKYQT
jgi:dUTP pyrophosphatase